MTTKTKRLRRSASDGGIAGNLVRVQEPSFLTLTKRPANQRAFPMVRSDNQGADMAQNTAPVVRRTRTKRNDDNKNLAALTFPSGYTEEKVNESLTAFGLTGYNVTSDGGVFKAQRSDLQSIAEGSTVTVKLTEDGVTAQVIRSETDAQPTEGQHGIKLVSLEFDIEKFDEEKIPEFLKRNDVDFKEEQLDTSANDKTVLKRSEVEEGAETRRIQLEDGVVAVISRADDSDVPSGFAMAVNEIAYGSWGWGQLDFNAAMADKAVCEQLQDGMWKLRDVLDNILFWSQLPVDSKKALVRRSLDQYADFVNGLLDLLPRQVLIAVGQTQRSDAGQSQEKAMATNTEAKGDTTQNQAAAKEQSQAQNLSRADVQSMIDEGLKGIPAMVTDAVKAALPAAPAQTERSDKPVEGDAAAAAQQAADAAAAKADDDASKAVAPLTRSDLEAAVKAAVEPLAEQIKTIQSTTIVRSDNGDPVAVAKQGADGKVKRSAGDVLKGAIPGLRK